MEGGEGGGGFVEGCGFLWDGDGFEGVVFAGGAFFEGHCVAVVVILFLLLRRLKIYHL